LLDAIDRTTPASVTIIHLLCDNLSIHNGKLAVHGSPLTLDFDKIRNSLDSR
jgi:hypothetical protein